MKRRDVARRLRQLGFTPESTRGSHETWSRGAVRIVLVGRNHDEDINKGTLGMIRRHLRSMGFEL